MNRFGPIFIALSALILSTGLVACSPSGPAYISEGNSYTAQTVISVLDVATSDSPEGEPTAEADRLNQQALVSLRTQGDEAAKAADVLTKTFASTAQGVPFYVERATYEGADSLIVAEMIGPKGGVLQDKRVWVIDDQGEILFSATRQN